jgi:hypothetical protein
MHGAKQKAEVEWHHERRPMAYSVPLGLSLEVT